MQFYELVYETAQKLTFFKTFVHWHNNLMGDSLLTLLFRLFGIAITGLLPCILAFRWHGSLAEYKTAEKVGNTASAIEKSVADSC